MEALPKPKNPAEVELVTFVGETRVSLRLLLELLPPGGGSPDGMPRGPHEMPWSEVATYLDGLRARDLAAEGSRK